MDQTDILSQPENTTPVYNNQTLRWGLYGHRKCDSRGRDELEDGNGKGYSRITGGDCGESAGFGRIRSAKGKRKFEFPRTPASVNNGTSCVGLMGGKMEGVVG